MSYSYFMQNPIVIPQLLKLHTDQKVSLELKWKETNASLITCVLYYHCINISTAPISYFGMPHGGEYCINALAMEPTKLGFSYGNILFMESFISFSALK